MTLCMRIKGQSPFVWVFTYSQGPLRHNNECPLGDLIYVKDMVESAVKFKPF